MMATGSHKKDIVPMTTLFLDFVFVRLKRFNFFAKILVRLLVRVFANEVKNSVSLNRFFERFVAAIMPNEISRFVAGCGNERTKANEGNKRLRNSPILNITTPVTMELCSKNIVQ